MTKADIVAQVSDLTRKDQKDVAPIVEALIKTINKSLIEGKPVYIRGFGTFNVVEKKAKIGRNISKGTAVSIPAHFAPVFTFCKRVKKLVKNNVKK